MSTSLEDSGFLVETERPDDPDPANNPVDGNPAGEGTEQSAAEADVPLSISATSAEQLAALQKQAEFLLDELWMGGADFLARSVQEQPPDTALTDWALTDWDQGNGQSKHETESLDPFANRESDRTSSTNGNGLPEQMAVDEFLQEVPSRRTSTPDGEETQGLDPSHSASHDQPSATGEPATGEHGPPSLPLESEIDSLLRGNSITSDLWPEDQLPAIHTGSRSQAGPPRTTSHGSPVFSQPPQAVPSVTQPEQYSASDTPGGSVSQPTHPGSVLDTPVSPPRPGPKAIQPIVPAMSAADLQVMEEEILDLYNAVNRILATRREITGHALSLLRESSEIIATEPHRVARAEHNIEQVRQILARAQAGRRESQRFAVRTVFYLLLWMSVFFLLGGALLFYPADTAFFVEMALAEVGLATPVHTFPVLWAALLGGLGGGLGTIFSLVDHIRTRQEFDHQYSLRSTIQPTMGILLGLILYLLLAVLFSSLGFGITANRVTSYLPAALAFPIGLWQEGVYALIFKLTTLLSFQRRRRW